MPIFRRLQSESVPAAHVALPAVQRTMHEVVRPSEPHFQGELAVPVQRAEDGEEDLGRQIRAAAGGGNSLDTGVQQRLEAGLAADLSGVRVHTDGEADRLSRTVSAVAFTTGSDIFFRSGAYNPTSGAGLHLLTHEATHTVQQAAGPVSGTPAPGGVSISDPGDSFEQAAEGAAARVIAGSPVPAQRTASEVRRWEEIPAIQRHLAGSSMHQRVPVQRVPGGMRS